jgi:hypothetical protein
MGDHRRTPAFSRWLKEATSMDRAGVLPHQDAKIAPIQPVDWNALLAAPRVGVVSALPLIERGLSVALKAIARGLHRA